MKSAKQLLEEYNAFSFRDPQAAAEMFANEGSLEIPYFESLGVRGRYQGREQIRGFFAFVRGLFPDLQLINTNVVCESADEKVVVAEYEFASRSSKTGRLIHQLIFGRLQAENGKIKLLRETINLFEVGRAIYMDGMAEMKLPERDATG